MAKKNSSPRKPTKKANTPNPSTTSSTTKKTTRKQTPPETDTSSTNACAPFQTEQGANQPTPDDLTPTQQHFLLQYLFKGASPYAACQQLNLPITNYLYTLRSDDSFRRQIESVYSILAQNVLAALYQTAMKGNVSAQSFWLKSNPPPGWQTEQSVTNQPHTFDDFFDKLTDHELLELARAMGLNLSPETERALFGQSIPQQPESIPP